tara:strand:- start:911 stop:1411 length:501 start_codon:yes stop_codon:yes gene_type:complete
MSFYYKMVPGDTYCITGYKGNEKHVEFPNNITITIIGDGIFKGHTELESIVLPETLTQIGGFAFDGCTGLKSIKLPESLEDMWQYAFTRTSIEEIEIPGSVKRIIPFTFNASKALKKVVIHEGTIEISAWAFKDCTSLTDVYLPKSMQSVHENAFDGCGDIRFHKA